MIAELGYGSRVLRKRIRTGMPSLWIELESLWNRALKELHGFQEGDTVQGTLHCLKVEDNIGLLLQDKLDKFKELDLFVLSAASALHDIGRIKTKGALTVEDHGERSAILIRSESVWPGFFESKRKAEAVSLVVGVHVNGKIDTLPETPFSVQSPPGLLLRSLAAILRLADMLDTNYSRCPHTLIEINALKFSESMEKWLAERGIGGWDFHYDNRTIILQESSEDNHQHAAVVKLAQLINESITESHKKCLENCPVLYWKESGLSRDIVHFPFKFQLSEPKEYLIRYIDTIKVFEEILEQYLSHLSRDYAKVNLDGIQTFRDVEPTDLSNVFLDVEIGPSTLWMPTPPKIDESISTRERETILSIWRESLPGIFNELKNKPLPVTKVLDSHEANRVVILGDPGSGKTTIGQYLCLSSSMQGLKEKLRRVKIPFRVILREFVRERGRRGPKYSILEHIKRQTGFTLRRKCPEDFVVKCLMENRSLVIFDGLDEVTKIDERENIREEILYFAWNFPKAQVIITSRTVSYAESPFDTNQFLHLKLRNLAHTQIVSFIDNWYAEQEKDPITRQAKITSLKRALDDPNVSELALNPLLLTIIVLVHKVEADLPKQRAALYTECADAFLAKREKARDLLSYDEYEVRDCHEYLGYLLHSKAEKEGGRSSFKLHELTIELKQYLAEESPLPEETLNQKVEEFIDVARRRVGLIIEKDELVSFGHRCFQEYFAASYLSSNYYGIENLWAEIKKKVFRSHWRQVMLLLAGILGNRNKKGLIELIDKLLKSNGKRNGLLMAGEIAADKVQMSLNTLFHISEEIIRDFFKSSSKRQIEDYLGILADLLETETASFILSNLRTMAIKNRKGLHSLDVIIRMYMTLPDHKEDPRLEMLHDSLTGL